MVSVRLLPLLLASSLLVACDDSASTASGAPATNLAGKPATAPLPGGDGLPPADDGGDITPPADEEPETPKVTLRVTPSLGQVFSGQVRAIAPGGGGLEVAELARAKTGPDGSAELELPADAEGPIVIEVTGDDGAVYYDEGLDTEQPLSTEDRLRTVIGSVRDGEVGVTLFTEAAVRMLEAEHGDLLALGDAARATLQDGAQINAALARVRDELAPELDGLDLALPPTMVGSAADIAALGTTLPDLYALKLAALARVGGNHGGSCDRPALRVLDDLADDLADGTLDGKRHELLLAARCYNLDTLADRLRTAAEQLAAAHELDSLLASLDRYVSAFVTALGQAGSGGTGDGPGGILPGDLLASWAGNYAGDWRVDDVYARIYVWPFGWQRDVVTEGLIRAAMESSLLDALGGCGWQINDNSVDLGVVNIDFDPAFAVIAQGDARDFTLPLTLEVLGYGVTGTTQFSTQGLLPTHIGVAYDYKGPLREMRFRGSCDFSYSF